MFDPDKAHSSTTPAGACRNQGKFFCPDSPTRMVSEPHASGAPRGSARLPKGSWAHRWPWNRTSALLQLSCGVVANRGRARSRTSALLHPVNHRPQRLTQHLHGPPESPRHRRRPPGPDHQSPQDQMHDHGHPVTPATHAHHPERIRARTAEDRHRGDWRDCLVHPQILGLAPPLAVAHAATLEPGDLRVPVSELQLLQLRRAHRGERGHALVGIVANGPGVLVDLDNPRHPSEPEPPACSLHCCRTPRRLGSVERFRHFRAAAHRESSAAVDYDRTGHLAVSDLDLHPSRSRGSRGRQHHCVDAILNTVAHETAWKQRPKRQRSCFLCASSDCIGLAGDLVKNMAVRRTEILGRPMEHDGDWDCTRVRLEVNGDLAILAHRQCEGNLTEWLTGTWNVLSCTCTTELRHAFLPQRVHVRQYNFACL
mmetsp:Transcript_221/g.489  ORF Transcript_221/g.489 Transcript_221/m.489 type:complete len:426 (-) Transcript_221:1387-2664(-)